MPENPHSPDESWTRQLAEDGFIIVRDVIAKNQLDELRTDFDRLLVCHPSGVDQRQLLSSPIFLDLLEKSPILDYARDIFGSQVQLLMYALRAGVDPYNGAARKWHRDFNFVTDRLLALNVILYLDDLASEDGATVVIPGSHRRREVDAEAGLPHPAEVAAGVSAGDILLNWSTLVHSGTPKKASGPRRLVLLYFGNWWMKRYEHDQPLPWRALVDASPERLQLLGLRMPGRDLHVDDSIVGHPWL